MKVYVVSSHSEGSGGFEWYWNQPDAEEAFTRELEIWRGTGTETTVRLVEYDGEESPTRDDDAGRERLTREIDSVLDLIEVTLPALQEEIVT